MGYFTILHIIVLAVLFVLFILLFVLALKETRKKIFWSMIFANFLVISTLAAFSMLLLDKYTKKAQVEGLTQKRILLTESIVFSGKIRNVGNFGIGQCVLEVKLVNNAVNAKNLKGSSVFKPTSGLKIIDSENGRTSTVIKEFVIAEDLKPGELRNFSVSMQFPSYFQKTTTHNKLNCR